MTESVAGRKINWDAEPPVYRVGWGLLGALIGGAMVAFVCVAHLSVLPEDVSYTDLAAVLLTAAGVILTTLAVAAGFAAVFGYSQMRGYVKRVAHAAAQEHTKQIVKDLMEAELATRKAQADTELSAARQRFQTLTDEAVASAQDLLEQKVKIFLLELLSPDALSAALTPDVLQKVVTPEILRPLVQRELTALTAGAAFSDDDEFDDPLDGLIDDDRGGHQQTGLADDRSDDSSDDEDVGQ